MRNLEGKHIALTASRKTEEMQTLLHKQGATSDVRSMQGTVKQDKETVTHQMKEDLDREVSWFIFTTGMGVTTLLAYANEAGIEEDFLRKIKSSRVAARGYKTVAALKKIGAAVDVRSDDGTTAGLKKQLEAIRFSGERVVIQQYGTSSPVLENFFVDQDADIRTWLPYIHYAPEKEAVDVFIQELVDEKYDAVCFTSGLQVKSLFGRVGVIGERERLLALFENRMIATAVGKVTAEALHEEGVQRVVSPTTERMGAMIVELGQYVMEK